MLFPRTAEWLLDSTLYLSSILLGGFLGTMFACRPLKASFSRFASLITPIKTKSETEMSMLFLQNLKRRLSFSLATISFVLLTNTSMAGSVSSCQKVKVKSDVKTPKRLTRCILALPEGSVGQTIEIKDHYKYVIATGKIIERRGRYAVAIFNKIRSDVRPGYSANIKVESSNDHWTATAAPF